jgi:Reverse transcriptase (RNA-dependent DNA polymerase)
LKDRDGHILIICKELYGLRSSGARWHDIFADCVSELGFFPCIAEPYIWRRRIGHTYEYVAVYVDDLAIAKDRTEFADTLEKKQSIEMMITPCEFHQQNKSTS